MTTEQKPPTHAAIPREMFGGLLRMIEESKIPMTLNNARTLVYAMDNAQPVDIEEIKGAEPEHKPIPPMPMGQAEAEPVAPMPTKAATAMPPPVALPPQ